MSGKKTGKSNRRAVSSCGGFQNKGKTPERQLGSLQLRSSEMGRTCEWLMFEPGKGGSGFKFVLLLWDLLENSREKSCKPWQ